MCECVQVNKQLLVGLGLVNKDFLAFVPSWERDQKVVASDLLEQVGGPVPIALATVARLGLPEGTSRIEFLGEVGTDAAGDEILQWLSENGVGVGDCTRVTGGITSRSLVLVDERDGTRTVANHRGDLPADRDMDSHQGVLKQARILHIDGRNSELCRAATEVVRSAGGLVSLDLGTMRAGTEKLWPLCDIVLASRKGGAGAFPEAANDPIEQTRRFLAGGVRIAGVTLGPEGVVVGERCTEPQWLPAFTVADVCDTCGAGDVFHGAFLWAFLRGKGIIECARLAQAAAAERIRYRGNHTGLPTLAAVTKRLEVAPPIPTR